MNMMVFGGKLELPSPHTSDAPAAECALNSRTEENTEATHPVWADYSFLQLDSAVPRRLPMRHLLRLGSYPVIRVESRLPYPGVDCFLLFLLLFSSFQMTAVCPDA